MNTLRTIIKKLLTQQDVEWGEGTVSQIRNGTAYTLNQMRTIYPVNSLAELNALDTTKFKKAMLFSSGVAQFYYFDSGMWKKDAGVVVQVVDNYAALATIPAAKGQLVQTREHSLSNKFGSAFYIGVLGLGASNGGSTSVSSDPAYHWEEVRFTEENTFGLLGVGDETTKLTNYASSTNILKLSRAITTSGTNIRQWIDKYFFSSEDGLGSVIGIYRKAVTPYICKSDDFYSQDLVPAKHLARACTAAIPVVLVFGDSTGTYAANTNCRGDMVIEALRVKLQQDFPKGVIFYNYCIGGQTWATLFSNQSSPSIPWYPTNTTNWFTDFTTLRKPDLIIFNFGMNDGNLLTTAHMKTALDACEALPKKPSVLIVTNLVPRIDSVNVTPGTEKAIMDGRDYAAGLQRTYAKYRGYGLIDMHRRACKAQDGFDPASTVMKRGTSITLAAGTPNVFNANDTCNERIWELYFDDSVGGTLAGSGIIISYGTGFPNNFLQLTRSAGDLGISFTAGGTVLVATYVPCSFTNTLQWNLTVEIKNGWLLIYQNWDPATNYGGYNEPIYAGKVAYPGGESVNLAQGTNLMNVGFWSGETIKNKPSITNSLLWGTESVPQGYAGSGYNHPSHWAGGIIHRPNIDSQSFYTYSPKTGTIAVPSGVGSIAVVFAPAYADEADATYLVEHGFMDGNPVATSRVEFRATTGFQVFFTANTTNASTMWWEVVRRTL